MHLARSIQVSNANHCSQTICDIRKLLKACPVLMGTLRVQKGTGSCQNPRNLKTQLPYLQGQQKAPSCTDENSKVLQYTLNLSSKCEPAS